MFIIKVKLLLMQTQCYYEILLVKVKICYMSLEIKKEKVCNSETKKFILEIFKD